MPNNRFSHKRTSTSGLLPNTTNSANSAYIAAGELAVNLTDLKIISSTGSVPFEVGGNLTSLYVGTGEITANATHLKLGSAALFANGSNGTTGQVLTSNGTSAYWATGGGGGGSPGGSTTQIQFNDGGAFAGSANLTFDTTTALVTIGNTTVNTQINATSLVVRALFANNSNGTSGQILFSNATGAYWGNYGIPQNAQTSAYQLAIADVGRHISITTGGVTVPNNATVAFTAGDSITIFNNSAASQTITSGAGVTMRFAGSTLTGNRTLLNWGLCTVICISASTFVISGSGLT